VTSPAIQPSAVRRRDMIGQEGALTS
jgi:hypothetical protein